MGRKRNLLPLAGLLLGLAAVAGYFALVLRRDPALSPLLDFPWLSLALLAAGLLLSIVGALRAFRQPHLHRGRVLAPLLGALNFGVAGFFASYLFIFSYDLPQAAGAPAVGALAPLFALSDQRAQSVRLEDLRGRNVLLVFYRGFW